MRELDRINQIVNFLVSTKKVENKKDLAQKLGYNYSALSQLISGKVNCSKSFVNNLEKFCEDNGFEIPDYLKAKTIVKKEEKIDSELVPVIPTDIYKEYNINIVEYVKNNNVNTLRRIDIFPQYDLVYVVNDTAMIPNITNGDYLFLKLVDKNELIINGDVYAINTKSNGLIVRCCNENGDSIICSAINNQRFTPISINKNDIINLFKIVGMTRFSI